VATAAAEARDQKGDDSDSDNDGFFMADFFTKDLDIEDDFIYTYGGGGGDGDGGTGLLTLQLKGVAREFGQTVLGSGDGTGLTVWRGAEELNAYLWARRETLVAGKRVLELGAGLGLVGLLVAHLKPALNVVTDGDEDCLKRLRDNFARNGFVPAATPAAASASSAAGAAVVAMATSEVACAEASSGPWLFAKDNNEADSSNSTSDSREKSVGKSEGGEGIREGGGEGRCMAAVVARLRWNVAEDLASARDLAKGRTGNHPAVGAAALDRGPELGTYDLVLAADVVYEVKTVTSGFLK
jgi:predicted nicotinamide N-methyase